MLRTSYHNNKLHFSQKIKSTIVDVKEGAKVRMEEEEREEEQEEEPWGEFNDKYENCKYLNKNIIEIFT